MAKVYSHKGYAGLVARSRRSSSTGTIVGLYHATQAGLEEDLEDPWATICEEHSTIVRHSSLRLARASMAHPEEWCGTCRGNATCQDDDEEYGLGYMQGKGAS